MFSADPTSYKSNTRYASQLVTQICNAPRWWREVCVGTNDADSGKVRDLYIDYVKLHVSAAVICGVGIDHV